MTEPAWATRARAAATKACGVSGTVVSAETGTEYTCDVVIEHVSDAIGQELGPIERRPAALIDSEQLPTPKKGDLLTVGTTRFRLDAPESVDFGLWRLPLLEEIA